MSVTIKDVAKYAGVSHPTVSMVIHDDPRISKKTKKRVHGAIKDLNYHPNYMARGLVRGRTNTIAIVASFFGSLFELNILMGIEGESEDPKYQINQYTTFGKEKTKNDIFYSIVHGKRADAVIAVSLKPDEKLAKEFIDNNIPILLLEEDMEDLDVVKCDNYTGAFIAAEHLIKSGRRKIGIISGEVEGEEVGLSPLERLSGYKDALAEYGLNFEEKYVSTVDNFYYNEGKAAFSRLLDACPEMDAVFCAAGDIVAAGSMNVAKNRGIAVPDDIAVVGYDNSYLAEIMTPALTTVNQPLFQMGKEALKVIINKLEGREKDSYVRKIFKPELVKREST